MIGNILRILIMINRCLINLRSELKVIFWYFIEDLDGVINNF
jgi:hypothetical protein